MAGYLAQVYHVRYWRGTIHRWSTRWEFNGVATKPIDAAACSLVLTMDDSFCFGAGNAANGGTSGCSIYASTGGVPVATVTRFDWETPAEWLAYGGSAWGSTTGLSFNDVAEAATSIKWQGGFSATGKPVFFRKWFHATISPTAVGGGQQIPATNVTSLTTAANAAPAVLSSYGLVGGTPAGRLMATTSHVDPQVNNHQMPRGRRRLVKAAARPASSFPPNVLVVPGSDGSLES